MTSQKKSTCLLAGLALFAGGMDTLRAQQTGQLVSTPAQITFNVQPGSIPNPQTLVLTNTGATSMPFTVQVATTSGGSWLLFSPGSGNTPANIIVSANSGSLSAGTYSGSVTVTSANATNSPLVVPVTLNVGQGLGGSVFSATPASPAFTYQTGASLPVPMIIAINGSGGTAVPFTAGVLTTSGGNWLLVSPTSGTTPANLNLSVNPSGLTTGTYNGTVHVAPTSGTGGALDIPVTLTINGTPTLTVSPATGLNFAYQTGTTAPGSQSLTFATDGNPVSFTLNPTTTSGGNWLVLSTFSGQASKAQPQTVTVSANTFGLLPGTYSGNVAVSAPGASTPTLNIPVSLLISTSPLLILGPAPQPFNFQLGGAAPATQTVQISSSSTPLNFTATATPGTGGNWLTVTPATGTTPQGLTLSANAQGLAAGQYNATVTLNSFGAGNSPQTIPVTLNVSATTMLNANTSGLTFNYQTTTNQQPQAQVVNVTSTGGPLTYTVAATSANCGGNWVTVSPTTGTTPGSFTVFVNTTGVAAPQNCTGTITISSAGSSNTVTVPVALNVSTNPLLNITSSALSFTVASGATTNPPAQVIGLSSTDPNTAVQFQASATTTSGGTWLFVGPNSGSTPNNVTVQVAPFGLAPGTYTGQVTITSPSLPAAQTIPVKLTITSNVTATVTPAAVNLAVPANATAPVTATVQVTSSGTSAVTFSTSATTSQGGNWLSVTPAGGNTPGTITISANGAGLSQGVYTGQVTLQIPGAANSPISIAVTLTVGPPVGITVNNQTITFTSPVGAASNPATQTINLTSTGGPVTFTVASATTSCGNFLTATPTTGTTPAAITLSANVANQPQGTCNGTVTITAPGLAPTVVNVALNVTAAAAPQITAVKNGASYVPGAIAPGEIIIIGGANLGTTTLTSYVLNTDNTFATTVANTSVYFDNIAAPILYVRNDLVAVVVPFEIAGRLPPTSPSNTMARLRSPC